MENELIMNPVLSIRNKQDKNIFVNGAQNVIRGRFCILFAPCIHQ